MDWIRASWPTSFLLRLDRVLSTHCIRERKQLTQKDDLHLGRWKIWTEIHLDKETNWTCIWHSTVMFSPIFHWVEGETSFVSLVSFQSWLLQMVLGAQFQNMPNQCCINSSETKEDRKISRISPMRSQFSLCNALLHLVALSASCCVSWWELK